MSRKLLLMVALSFAASGEARAQSDWEVFFGFTSVFPALETQFDASYAPSRVLGIGQLFAESDPRSSARQLLNLEGRTSVGLGFGVNFFPHRTIGLQFLLDRARVGIVGENPPHEVSLTYDTVNFPFPDRVVRTFRTSLDVPKTQGRLEQTTLSFNVAARLARRRAVSASLSGGLSHARFRGEAETLSALAAWLGGHSVLFSELYESSFSTDPAAAFGFNLGGQLDVSLGSHVAVFFDGRLVRMSKTETAVRLDELLSLNVVTVPLEQVEAFLDLPPFLIDPSYERVLIGLKWRP